MTSQAYCVEENTLCYPVKFHIEVKKLYIVRLCMQGGGPVDNVAIPVPVQLEGADEQEDEGEGEDEEDGEPVDGGEVLEGEEEESHRPVEVAGIEGVAEGGANHEGVVGGAQIQHLVPGDDAERLSSSSPSSLFRLEHCGP